MIKLLRDVIIASAVFFALAIGLSMIIYNVRAQHPFADVTQAQPLEEAAGGGLVAFSDDFNRADSDSLGANWTEIAGDIDIVSNQANSPATFDFTERAAVYSATACTTADQYLKVTVDGPASGPGVGAVLRHTLSGEFYQLQFDPDEAFIMWKYFPTAGGTAVTIQTLNISPSQAVYPQVVGITVTGTGNSTVVRVWFDPSANAPDSVTSWDSGAADFTLSDDPATAADSGKYLGLGVNDTTVAAIWDNFYGGDVP